MGAGLVTLGDVGRRPLWHQHSGWLFATSEHVKSVVWQSLSAGFLSVSVDRLRVWARAVSWIGRQLRRSLMHSTARWIGWWVWTLMR
ncbi:hypothetical protein BZL30_3629 [Mycobacterium kansasii]|uniref:Uncharacterized protein n=1 Tax=Mycobacterium kansasii TaxID=1768 RepID=A0A1V3X9Q3_MYCKA|nr:hypothetical protein BZL30_3629 [Mycobacterium kansasii]